MIKKIYHIINIDRMEEKNLENISTTTDIFQLNPNFYTSKEECERMKKVNTNPRYKHFKQTNFTAGDEDQFEQYRDFSNKTIKDKKINLDDNLFKNLGEIENIDWKGYSNLQPLDISNTFKYLFNKFKKGIYVKIKDNKLINYLPFSKVNFTNEWGDRISQDPKIWNTLSDFLIYTAKLGGFNIDEKRVNKFTNTWYANNFLTRSEYPTGEGDSGVPTIKDMLLELCKNRKVPDIEFFINRRDNPILKRDGTEPYESLYDSDNYPLVSHKFEKYAPILSMVTSKNFADIPMPTFEDWARVSNIADDKFFDKCRNFKFDFSKPFSERKDIAVFRGASTGEGTEIETNPRLKLAYLSKQYPEYLDAGITKWNTRARKEKGKKFLTTINPKKLGLELVKFLTPEEQSGYKYIINVDGHVSAYRLSLELSMGSVILLRESRYKMWFTKYLQPYKEYVPIKADLSDLVEKIEWCRKNEKKCEEIVENAKKFYKKYLGKEGIFDYLQLLLTKLDKTMGFYYYNQISTKSVCYKMEKNYLDNIKKFNLNLGEYELRSKNELFKLLTHKKINYEDYPHQEVYKNDRTIIYEFQLQNEIEDLELYQKFSKDYNENLNGGFIGHFCVNNMIRYIPNFMYTIDWSEDYQVIEKVDGIVFRDWLTDHFRWDDYLWIMLQISLVLEFSQNYCLFMHRDLYPWNILIKKLDKPIEISYPLFNKGVYKVKTSLIPVFIDFGKSKGMYEGINYGLNNINNFYPFQDCITILLSSLNILLSQKLGYQIVDQIMKFSSIFYKAKNLYDLRGFITSRKKYNEIVYGNLDLYLKNHPIDLYNHILTLFDFRNVVKVEDRYSIPINVTCSKDEIKTFKQSYQDYITLFEDGNIDSIYKLNLLKNNLSYFGENGNIPSQKLKENVSFDIREIKLNEEIFENLNQIERLKTQEYKIELEDNTLFQVFMLRYIDKVMDMESKNRIKGITDKNNYKEILVNLTSWKSFQFYWDIIGIANQKYLKSLEKEEKEK